jgi:hypothetical protein
MKKIADREKESFKRRIPDKDEGNYILNFFLRYKRSNFKNDLEKFFMISVDEKGQDEG